MAEKIDPRMVKWNAPVDPNKVKWDAKPMNREELFKDFKERGWGSGVDANADEVGGAVTDFAAKYLPPEAAASLGYAANVGLRAVPALFGGTMAKSLGAPVMEAAAKKLMQSAVKPTIQDLSRGKADRAIQTLLDEGVNPTKAGIAELRVKANELTKLVDDAIANSPATVAKSDVGRRLIDTVNKFKNQVNPQQDIDAVRKAWLEFKNHPDLAGKEAMSVQKAQAMKKGTYQQLADKAYGEMGSASTEAQKALARGLKEEISKAVPDVSRLNAKQSDLFNAINVAERRALLSENVNPMSLALLANNPAAGAGFLADKSILAKSLLARGLYSSRNGLPYGLGATAGGILGNGGQLPDGILSQLLAQ